MTAITVYGRNNSVNVQKVMWCVAELGLEVERIDAGGAFGGLDTPDYLAMNPNARIPTLKDGDFVLWESNAIVRYLAEAYGTATPWFPDSAAARALCDQWMDWYLTTLHPPMTTIFWTLIRTPEAERDAAKLAAATMEAGRHFAILDAHLADNAWIAGGDGPSMGDVPVGCSAYRWFNMAIKRPELPHLETWYRKLEARQAFQAHVKVALT